MGSAPFSCREVPRSATANAEAGADSGGDAVAPGYGDAGNPNASAYVSLPLIPAGTLGESRSFLAVANGCARPISAPVRDGGDGGDLDAGDAEVGVDRESPLDTGACGTGFGPTTLGLTLVRLSRRTNFSKVGFQTVNASNAASPASFLVEQANTKVSVYFTDSVVLGQITPRALPTFVNTGDLGVVPTAAILRVTAPTGGTPFPEFHTDLATVLAANQLTGTDLTEATNFTFVLLGARPGRVLGSGEQPFQIDIVENAPKGPDAD